MSSSSLKLNYFIIDATTTDKNIGNLSDISLPLNSAIGWFSQKFCNYPQTIYIKFNKPVILNQINLLFHEKFIPERVEFFSYFPLNDYEYFNEDIYKMNFVYFGFIIPDNNMKTNYSQREYKKIYVKEKALYLKINLYKNYDNRYNIFSQISIITLECFGELLPFKYEKNFLNQNFDINDININKICGEKLNYFKEQLKIESEKENYIECKIIQENIENCKKLAKNILILQNEKLMAVKEEDFDKALELKNQIEKIQLLINNLGIKENNNKNENNQNTYSNEKSEPKSSFDNLNITNINMNNENYQSQTNNDILNDKILNNLSNQMNTQKTTNSNIVPQKIIFNEEDYKPYDDIIIPAARNKNNNNNSNYDLNDQSLSIQENLNNLNNNNILTEIDENSLEKYKILLPYTEKEGIQKLLSEKLNNKIEGLQIIRNKLNEIFVDENLKDILKLIFEISFNLFYEKNVNLFLLNLDFLKDLFDYIIINKEKVSKKLIKNDRLFKFIINKFSDNNDKIRENTQKLFEKFLNEKLIDQNYLINLLISEEIRNNLNYYQSNNKSILVKLKILFNFFETSFEYDENFPHKTIMIFLIQNCENPISEIRKMSRLLINKLIIKFGLRNYINDLIKLNKRELNKLANEIPELKESLETSYGINFDKKNQGSFNNSDDYYNNHSLNNSNGNINSKKKKTIVAKKKLKCIHCYKILDDNDTLENHFKTCKMFMKCFKCNENIEIKSLNNHLLFDCIYKNNYKLCKRCREAISVKNYDEHVRMNICNPAKNKNSNNRCPLCHNDIPPTDKGFYQHFIIDGCPQKKKKNKKERIEQGTLTTGENN